MNVIAIQYKNAEIYWKHNFHTNSGERINSERDELVALILENQNTNLST